MFEAYSQFYSIKIDEINSALHKHIYGIFCLHYQWYSFTKLDIIDRYAVLWKAMQIKRMNYLQKRRSPYDRNMTSLNICLVQIYLYFIGCISTWRPPFHCRCSTDTTTNKQTENFVSVISKYCLYYMQLFNITNRHLNMM